MNNDASNLKKPDGPRVITLRLRLPVLIVTLVLFAIGLIWIFMAGVLAGRGYNTQEEIGVLASFMPSPPVAEPTGSAAQAASGDANAAKGVAVSGDAVISGNTAAAGNADASGIDRLFAPDSGQAGTAAVSPADANNGLLRGEDLAFKDSLTAPLEPPAVASSATRTTGGQPAQSTQTGRQAGQTAGGAGANAANSAPTRAAAPAQAGATDAVVYEYIYQVSSFSQLHQAQLLVQKLQDAGINAQIELHRAETGSWYRVLVSFKGRNSELEAFNARLKQFNLGAPMLRKKTAISR